MPTALCYIRKSTVSYSIIVLDLANINFKPIFIFQTYHNENYLQKNLTWIILIVLNLFSLEVPYKVFNMIKASLQTNTKAAPPFHFLQGMEGKRLLRYKNKIRILTFCPCSEDIHCWSFALGPRIKWPVTDTWECQP